MDEKIIDQSQPEEARKPRRLPVSKAQFLDGFTKYMKAQGVVFKVDNKIMKSKEMYWDLFKGIFEYVMASAASAGTTTSLSGVGTFLFKELGKTEESRSLRFRYTPSSKYKDFFDENQDLILVSEAPTSAEEYQQNVCKILAAINPAAPAVTADATDEVAEPVEVVTTEEEVLVEADDEELEVLYTEDDLL